MKMGAASEVLGHWIEEITADWGRVRSWAERLFTRERVADTVLLLATLTLWAVLLFYLYNALLNRTIVGISPYLSSSLNSQLSVPGY